jgi:hypothetical protein
VSRQPANCGSVKLHACHSLLRTFSKQCSEDWPAVAPWRLPKDAGHRRGRDFRTPHPGRGAGRGRPASLHAASGSSLRPCMPLARRRQRGGASESKRPTGVYSLRRWTRRGHLIRGARRPKKTFRLKRKLRAGTPSSLRLSAGGCSRLAPSPTIPLVCLSQCSSPWPMPGPSFRARPGILSCQPGRSPRRCVNSFDR